MLYPVGKPWTPEEPEQLWFAWKNAAEALAGALTWAGLGVGVFPVSVGGFVNDRNNRALGVLPYFDPPLTGVYVQIGSRPVAETIEWIKQGRPDELGNKAAQ